MIRVGIITGWTDKCGITQYAHHMMQYIVHPDISMKVAPMNLNEASYRASEFDIMLMNESGYTMAGFNQGAVDRIKAHAKLVLILHASNPENNVNDFTKMFDKVVHHELTAKDDFVKVPQGCPVFNDRGLYLASENVVGTNGFPLPHKNLQNLAAAVERVGMELCALTPDSHHVDATWVEKEIKSRNPKAHVYKEWLTDEQMLGLLAKCAMVCYPYWNSTPGPSAAAMIGIASGRPVIVSRCNQFKHLFKYDDQFYFIESDNPTVEDIVTAIESVIADTPIGYKLPNHLYESMNWNVVADEYIKLFQSLAA